MLTRVPFIAAALALSLLAGCGTHHPSFLLAPEDAELTTIASAKVAALKLAQTPTPHFIAANEAATDALLSASTKPVVKVAPLSVQAPLKSLKGNRFQSLVYKNITAHLTAQDYIVTDASEEPTGQAILSIAHVLEDAEATVTLTLTDSVDKSVLAKHEYTLTLNKAMRTLANE